MSIRTMITASMTFTALAASFATGCAEERGADRAEATAAPAPAAVPPKTTDADKIERGRYIVSAGACHDCHTPFAMGPNGPAPDMSRALSGHPESMVLPPPPALPPGPWIMTVAATNTAWSGPWGVSFTANITPDPETGIGKWTARNFIDTIRNGRHMGAGRPLLPPMPSAVFANYTDEDLEAIFAYLQSVPAIKNRVPQPIAPTQAAGPAPADGKLSRK